MKNKQVKQMMRDVGAFDYEIYIDTLIRNTTIAALRPKKKYPIRFTKSYIDKSSNCITRNYFQVLDSLVQKGYIVGG